MVLELTVLHVLHEWQVELRDVVLVHVEEDVSDHDDALLDLFPDAVELLQEFFIGCRIDLLGNWFQQFHRGVPHTIVEHLTVLVEDQAVGRTVKLLIGKGAGLLVVNLVDGVLDSLPVLLGLRPLHVCIAHLISVNQEFVSWKS